MEMEQLIEDQTVDLHERLVALTQRTPQQRWDKASITHVGTVSDEDTLQRVDLYRVELQPAVGDDLEHGFGPYDVLTATYIHNFWGDAEKRGGVADVVVLNGMNGYVAADPADTMFPPIPADG